MNKTQTILKNNFFDSGIENKNKTFFYKNDKDKRFFKASLVKVDERIIERESKTNSGFEEKHLAYEYTATFLEKDGAEKSYKVEQKPALIDEDYYYILDGNDNIEHIFLSSEKEKLKDFITIADNVEKPKRSLLSKLFLRNGFMLSEIVFSPFIIMATLFCSYSWYHKTNAFPDFNISAIFCALSFMISAVYYGLQFKLWKKYDQFDQQYIDNAYSQFD